MTNLYQSGYGIIGATHSSAVQPCVSRMHVSTALLTACTANPSFCDNSCQLMSPRAILHTLHLGHNVRNGRAEETSLDAAARGWQAEVFWACIEVQFATAPPGIAAEGIAMQLLAQLRGSCSSALLQVGAGRAMEWKQGKRRACVVLSPVVALSATIPYRILLCFDHKFSRSTITCEAVTPSWKRSIAC
jgi:hypothetical protein